MEAIKVIPEIIKVKERTDACEFDFDVSALRKKMIIETYFTGGSSNKKSIANSSA
jgi:acetylornithine aminotransferase